MPFKAALFDVDGTIVDGNCTRIFLDYLFEKGLINQADFILFDKKHQLFSRPEYDYRAIIEEALNLVSALTQADFQAQWNACYEEKVKNRLNHLIVKKIKEYKVRGIPVFLASGSPVELVSLIGTELNIPKDHIIATEPNSSHDQFTSEPVIPICYKEGKKEKVMNRLRAKGIDLKDTCFFSDNLADLELLSLAGQGYWTGPADVYTRYALTERGIALWPAIPMNGRGHKKRLPPLPRALFDYYTLNRALIEGSLSELLPIKCTPESMDFLVGKVDLTWDFVTLQKYFFDPLHEYVKAREVKILCLGSILFIEAAGLKADRYGSLIGIGELLDICQEMFRDIRDWTSSPYSGDRSHLDISIIGNVAVALLTMPVHVLISDKAAISDEKQLKLLEKFVSVGFESMFGNGLELFREEHPSGQIPADNYDQMIYLKNKRMLEIPCILWLILQQNQPSLSVRTALYAFIENMMMGIQYGRILHSGNRKGKSHPAGCLESSHRAIEYREKAFRALKEVPMSRNYRKLIMSYCDYLIDQGKDLMD
ncbi:MAG TPA: HAD-IB family phosphatase [Bacteroidales bacterium]|nr:HAD-IB family phosphatase [Bacteroidales bacterium]